MPVMSKSILSPHIHPESKIHGPCSMVPEDKPKHGLLGFRGGETKPAAARIISLPEELFGDALTFLDTSDLFTCELLCRRVQRMIAYRKLWRVHFEYRVLKDKWCWPRGALLINWKTFYCKYEKEIQVRHALRRNEVSGKFVWRCTNLWEQLTKPLETHRSRSFHLGHTDGDRLKWKILFQRLVRDQKDHLGIFLQQKYKPIRCFFSLSVLGDDGTAVSSHSCPKQFQGGRELDNSTCGWLFSLDSLAPVLGDDRRELVVELDLTVFPNELSAVAPLLQLISKEDTPEELRRVTVSSLGDFVTHYAPNPTKAKQYLQELNGGPLPLIDLLDSPKSKAQIRSAAAGALWNILDTSRISITPHLLARMINAACLSLNHLFIGEDGYRQCLAEDPAHSDAVGAALEAANAFEEDEELAGPRGGDLREHLVNALTGLMWNIPILNDYRRMMATNRFFFPALFTILDTEAYSRTHFTCLHLISTLHHHGYLPAHLRARFVRHLEEYIAAKDASETQVSAAEVGVLLSLRDVADFFVPLLLSQKVECVLFGKWCMELFYFKSPVAI
jgi:hypothetical protein